ncbi:MAG TPA: hypothetical protein VGM39_25585 [Kofleriaceae bacterium]
MRALVLLPLALAACIQSAPNVAEGSDRPWATYTIAAGEHDASVDNREPRNPIDGVTDVVGRDYELALNDTAMYVLTQPTQPGDQFDWNKLPGLSDCGSTDLSTDGAMFGWRWRVDMDPMQLEITAYANNNGEHITSIAPLVTLSADDLTEAAPLHYRVARDQDMYTFSVRGSVGERHVDAATTITRRCVEMERDPLAWAGAFYFGGTSVAPQTITAQMRERPYIED